MSKPVYITTDSTCDLTPELLERFQIKTVPLHVVLGEEVYLDGVEFTPDMIYERYAKDKILPRTAAVSPQEFTEFFTPLVEAGYEVVHLDISSELSGTYQNAVIAAADLPGVYPIDTRQLTTGMGEMLLVACRMRDEGKDAATIVQAMQDLISKVNVSFVIDTLEYMWKGGRCTGVAAFGANLLHLKPCIEMRDGKLEVCKKYRGNISKVYEKYIEERLTGKKIAPDYIFITTSVELEPDMKERLEALVRRLTPVKEVIFTRTGCTVTSHCGPGTLGVLFLEE
ncbi:MAG: DegV family protein [Evtepia sp.]|uniref:DegV family protein n=1 Tax=Evtepia sp. TaxID=2773933 RepID=UPI002A7630F9|nr:DegV family protein [Evtepia sp.]MDY3015204.1 DegV family protein [Evtepia sp.]